MIQNLICRNYKPMVYAGRDRAQNLSFCVGVTRWELRVIATAASRQRENSHCGLCYNLRTPQTSSSGKSYHSLA